jgi:hypothetical protein
MGGAVYMNGELLVMREGGNEIEVIPYVERGELLVLWELHKPNLGNAVTITTGEPLGLAYLPSGRSRLSAIRPWLAGNVAREVQRPSHSTNQRMSCMLMPSSSGPYLPGKQKRRTDRGINHPSRTEQQRNTPY